MTIDEIISGHLYTDESGNIYKAEERRSDSEFEFTTVRLNLATLSFIPTDIGVIFDKFDILHLTEVGESAILSPELVLNVSDILSEFAGALKQRVRPMESNTGGTYSAVDEDDIDEILKQFKEKYTK